MTEFFYTVLFIFVVVMLFNVMIFIHELGHFLAARWRGLQVDRFQIWFGKPIWKKEINGVQYGLGWIPAGGFVALPQMAAMESIEGDNLDEKPLPPVSPLDKIIVAFAGPLFSLMLAVLAALAVWGMGKPQDAIKSNVIGGVQEGSAADGILRPGDKILKIDGEPVQWFHGRIFDDIMTRIMLTEGSDIDFEIERDGVVQIVTTQFNIAETPWYKRRALPRVGIRPGSPVIVDQALDEGVTGEVIPKNLSVIGMSPASKSGLKKGDQILKINDKVVYGIGHANQLFKDFDYQKVNLLVKRGEEELSLTVTPEMPLNGYSENPMLGVYWDSEAMVSTEILHPNPWEQIRDSLRTMWMTIKTISSPTSNVGVDQLSGPIGIARTKFLLLQEPDGWLRVLAFFVLFNVNLAVLNMMPLPVLDGGHIVMAIMEWVRGKPLPQRLLEFVQTAFALLLMGFMLYITTKDIGDEVNETKAEGKRTLEWPKS